MNRNSPRQWGASVPTGLGHGRSPVRTLVGAELPETRIFIDQIYHELTAAGRRIQTDRLVQSRDNLPWLVFTHDDDASR